MANVKSNGGTDKGQDKAKHGPMSPADVFFLLAILSALPWGVRIKAMIAALDKLTPEQIGECVARFKAYHENILVKMDASRETLDSAVFNAQWEIVSAIRSGDSAIVKAANSVLQKKRKAATDVTVSNKLANTPARELFADLKADADFDPAKV